MSETLVSCKNIVEVMRSGAIVKVAACRRGKEDEENLTCGIFDDCRGLIQAGWNSESNRNSLHKSARGDRIRVAPLAQGVRAAGKSGPGKN